MKILIISHTPHYQIGDAIAGWGPTVQEINFLSQLFDEVVHIAPLHAGVAPASALQYKAHHIRLRPVLATGGSTFLDKLNILRAYLSYAQIIWDEMNKADVVHLPF